MGRSSTDGEPAAGGHHHHHHHRSKHKSRTRRRYPKEGAAWQRLRGGLLLAVGVVAVFQLSPLLYRLGRPRGRHAVEDSIPPTRASFVEEALTPPPPPPTPAPSPAPAPARGKAQATAGKAPGKAAAASPPPPACPHPPCITVDLSDTVPLPELWHGIFFEDINNAGEGGLHVEMLRDFSFEARAFLQENPALAMQNASNVKPRLHPGAPPAVHSGSPLQQLSMDPDTVASAPLRDLEAWGWSPHDMEVAIAPSLTAPASGAQLHALCMRQPEKGKLAQAVNSGHTLEGFYLAPNTEYVVQMRVRSGVKEILAVISSANGAKTYARHVFSDVLTAPSLAGGGGKGFAGGANTSEWLELRATVKTAGAWGGDATARFAVRFEGPGALCLDYVSLTPASAWKEGVLQPVAAHLVEALRPLAPSFLRFPGGAALEGVHLSSAYRWKSAAGPRELRPGRPNANWGYWDSGSLGIHELFDLAEALGAAPVWVVNVGISQAESVAPHGLDPWIKDAMDSLEYVLGDHSTPFGRMRAAQGREEPWDLRHVALGNEECLRPWYLPHYLRFAKAIRARYGSKLKLIANCDFGASHNAHFDFWEFHSYKRPSDLFALSRAFDEHEGSKPVAVTEFAAMPDADLPAETVATAMAEAGLLTALERNCRKVSMISFAPLLRHERLTRWRPTLVVFNESDWYPTPSYVVQQAFAQRSTGRCARVTMEGAEANPAGTRGVQASATCEAKGGGPCVGTGQATVAIKLVNFDSEPRKVSVKMRQPKTLLQRMGLRPTLGWDVEVESYGTAQPNTTQHGYGELASKRLAARRLSGMKLGASGRIVIKLPAYSLNIVLLKRRTQPGASSGGGGGGAAGGKNSSSGAGSGGGGGKGGASGKGRSLVGSDGGSSGGSDGSSGVAGGSNRPDGGGASTPAAH